MKNISSNRKNIYILSKILTLLFYKTIYRTIKIIRVLGKVFNV